jgi:4'-phosphopantetheinyl transferase
VGSDEPLAGDPEALSEAERERAVRFYLARDRDRFVGRRVYLRTLLAAYLGRRPAELRYVEGRHGKPALAPDQAEDLTFNLSHSHGGVLVAVARGRELGVDLEAHASLTDPDERDRVARRILDRDEQAEWEALAAAARPDAFFRLWTRKEALLKALGIGLRIDPSAIHVGFGERAATSDPRLVEFGALRDLPAPAGHAAAVCAAGTDWTVGP